MFRCCYKSKKRACICCCSWCLLFIGALIIVSGILIICAQEPFSKAAEIKQQEWLEESKDTHPYPQLSDLSGVWDIDNEIHPAITFTLSEESVVSTKESEKHVLYDKISCCSGGSPIIGAVQMRISDPSNVWRDGRPPWYLRLWFVHDNAYKWILHKNGLVKFLPTPGSPTGHAFMMARADSKSWWDWLKNIVHAHKYGCYCFAVLYKEDGLLKIRRDNRWHTKMDHYYNMTRRG